MPTTQRVAYVRVSSAGQNLARQLEAIGDVDKTYREYQSGSTTSQRPVLREALDYVATDARVGATRGGVLRKNVASSNDQDSGSAVTP